MIGTTETLSRVFLHYLWTFWNGIFEMLLVTSYSILTGSLTLTLMILPWSRGTTGGFKRRCRTVGASWRSWDRSYRILWSYVLLPALCGIVTGVMQYHPDRIVGESWLFYSLQGSLIYYLPKIFLADFWVGGTWRFSCICLCKKAKYLNEAFGATVVLLVIVLVINGLAKIFVPSFFNVGNPISAGGSPRKNCGKQVKSPHRI